MTNVTQQFVRAVQAIISAGTPLYKFCSFNEKTPRIWRVFRAQKGGFIAKIQKRRQTLHICLPLASAHLEAMLATKFVQPSHKGTNFLQSCKYHLILRSPLSGSFSHALAICKHRRVILSPSITCLSTPPKSLNIILAAVKNAQRL